jgi:hypothetical protein
LHEFVNIVDRRDPVVRLTNGVQISESPYAQERPDSYRLIKTNMNESVGASTAADPHNNHSFYKYAQTPEFQKALGFMEGTNYIGITRPFDPWSR